MSRRKLTRLIDQKHKTSMSKIKSELKAARYVCTTADIWSTRQRSFLGVTAHWVLINIL